MKKHFFHYLTVALASTLIISCNKTSEVNPSDDPLEYKHLRVVVNDEVSKEVFLVTPRTGETQKFETVFPKASLYVTESGRYASVVHREKNLVQFFDSGLEYHGDHIDVKGTPKWAAMTGESLAPTHFKSKSDEVLLFNDGDGTLSVGKETDFHITGAKLKTINASKTAHHGAMTKFNNGNYAVTEKDGSVAGVLPERVRIINASGQEIHKSTIQTKGIHGNASDGTVSVFGSASGILVVNQTGEQRLIAHPSDFGTAWFGTILEATKSQKFIGYTAAKGAYLIDVVANTVTPIVQSTDIMQCKVDYAGNRLVVLLHSGEVQIFNLSNNTLLKTGNVMSAIQKDEVQKPQLEATDKYLYITQPKTGELLQIEIANLTNKKTIKVSSTPYRLTLLGHESSEDH